MWVITDNIRGFDYYIYEKKSPLYGNVIPDWTGLIDNAKKFPDKESASIYQQKHNIDGEVKKIKGSQV